MSDRRMTDWSRLHHAYGPADDVPGLLARVGPDVRDPVWTELWSRLCHQGSVYPASYAALPELAGIAERWPPADRVMPLALAGGIVAGGIVAGDTVAGDGLSPEAARLAALTEETLRAPLDDLTYIHMLQALLAFEGVAVWGERLDGLNDEEYAVTCPHCDAEVFVAIGRYGTFSTRDGRYMNDADVPRRPLVPADPADLAGLGRRLHDRARADGHPDVAARLTYAFGHADCPACGRRFPVDAAVAAAE